ncbi:Pkinase-domain-containing protein, partial [Wilcoxina mikolae CBS 423.85]
VGDWILGRQLGKGANAHVRLAKNMITGKLAAVKVLPKRSQEDPDDRLDRTRNIRKYQRGYLPSSYEREIAILRLMDHENIVSLFDVFESPTSLFLVMDYADGGELFGYLTKYGRMSEDEAMPMFRQILSALYYCQMVNITHRDLKPENIFMMSDGTVKLGDFGLGKITPKGKLFDSACGSPHYIAPEIASFRKYDARKTDVWSLGCVLYTCLAGHLPFEGETQEDLLQAVRHGVFKIHRHFSEQAIDLLKKMMCVNPRKRVRLSQIFKHPLVKKYEPRSRDGTRGRASDINPGPLNMYDVVDPVITSANDVDAETMQNLRTLHPDKSDEQIIYQLKANV